MSVPSIVGHLLSLGKEQWLDEDELGLIRARRLCKMLDSAARTRYYGESARTVKDGAAALESIPLTSKADIQKSPQSFIPRGTKTAGLHELRTAGSTGIPLKVLFDAESFSRRIASEYFVTGLWGRGPLGRMVTLFDKPRTLHLLRGRPFFPELSLSIFEGEKSNLDRMLRWRASFLNSYPSTASLIARENELCGPPLRLKSVFTRGEKLTVPTRRFIERSFGCTVYDQYGLNEFGCVAWECPERRKLHVDSASSIVEIVGPDGRLMKSGAGEIVVSGLFNRAMPLLRYRTGDRARWGVRCSCGRAFPVLEGIEGRLDDFIVLPSGRICPPSFIDDASEVEGLCAFQLIQDKPACLTFRYVLAKGGDEKKARGWVRSHVRRFAAGERLDISFERVSSITPEKGGKIKTVISHIHPDSGRDGAWRL